MKSLIVDVRGNLSVEEVPQPTFGENQALVRMLSCGVCNGTDAKLVHRRFKGIGESDYPLMLGHEGVGRVIETGTGVTGLQPGDLVLLPFNAPAAGYHSAWGAFSEYGVVNDAEALAASGITDPDLYECALAQTVLPPGIDPVEASVIITLREVLSAINRFGISADSSVAIFGCGPAGLTFVRMLHLLGVRTIIALGKSETQLISALAMGADYTFESRQVDLVAAVRKICPAGASHVVDAVGLTSLISQAMPLLADQGKICCYGIAPETSAVIDWAEAPYNWQMQFQQFPSKREEYLAHKQVMDWIASGAVCLKDFISDILPFDEILIAFKQLEAKKISKKCVIRFPE